jgi:hypothetical protein
VIKVASHPELDSELDGQPLLVRDSPREYTLHCSSKFAATTNFESYRPLLGRELARVPDLWRRLTTESGPLKGSLDAPLVHANRALAKVALNFLAYSMGPEVARLRPFDRHRAFVLRGAPLLDCLVNLEAIRAGEHESRSDASLVAEKVLGVTEDARRRWTEILSADDRHVVVLGGSSIGLFVLMSFWGRPVGLVPLIPWPVAEGQNFPIAGVWAAAVVNPKDAHDDDFGAIDPGRSEEGRASVEELLRWVSSRSFETLDDVDLTRFERSPPESFLVQARLARRGGGDDVGGG